jgi:uncharacterized repeat protein (TIGR01451 family)
VPNPLVQGTAATIAIVVSNAGPSTATAVTVGYSLPSQLTLNAAVATAGSCSGTSCTLASLGNGATATISVTVTPTAAGIFTVTATVAAKEPDPNASNGTASASVAVRLPLTSSAPPSSPPPAPILPPPLPGFLVNAQPVTGIVLVNGAPLGVPGQIPVGSFVNTTGGSIQLVAQNQTGLFDGGTFRLVQGEKPGGFTTLLLQPAVSTGVCGKAPKRRPATVARPKVLALLRGNGKGRFRTQGRYASATVRGTSWLIADRCDGTFVSVTAGLVAVYDIVLRRTIIVTAGHSYLARPRG